MNNLSKLIPLLHPSGIMVSKILNIEVKENRLVGLSVRCSPLRKDELIEKIKGIIGEEFNVYWHQHDGEVIIENKK